MVPLTLILERLSGFGKVCGASLSGMALYPGAVGGLYVVVRSIQY